MVHSLGDAILVFNVKMIFEWLLINKFHLNDLQNLHLTTVIHVYTNTPCHWSRHSSMLCQSWLVRLPTGRPTTRISDGWGTHRRTQFELAVWNYSAQILQRHSSLLTTHRHAASRSDVCYLTWSLTWIRDKDMHHGSDMHGSRSMLIRKNAAECAAVHWRDAVGSFFIHAPISNTENYAY
jgi:hypothetical protein